MVVAVLVSTAAINIDRDFFKRDESYENDRITKKSQSKYELNFNLSKYSILNLKKSGLKTKVKGNRQKDTRLRHPYPEPKQSKRRMPAKLYTGALTMLYWASPQSENR